MKTSVYIDGFNLYYGCFRPTSGGGGARCSPADKWLNVRLLATALVGPDDSVHLVHFFTAHVHRSLRDPEQNLRQLTYLRALRTTPGVKIHFGNHIPVERRGFVVQPKPQDLGIWDDQMVVIKTFEEKGSDVNLATQLVEDSFGGEIERAIVVSNDTDLVSPILSARKRIRVSVVSPQPTIARRLKSAAEVATLLDVTLLSRCRLGIPVLEVDGTPVYPPRSWQVDDGPDWTVDTSG